MKSWCGSRGRCDVCGSTFVRYGMNRHIKGKMHLKNATLKTISGFLLDEKLERDASKAKFFWSFS